MEGHSHGHGGIAEHDTRIEEIIGKHIEHDKFTLENLAEAEDVHSTRYHTFSRIKYFYSQIIRLRTLDNVIRFYNEDL